MLNDKDEMPQSSDGDREIQPLVEERDGSIFVDGEEKYTKSLWSLQFSISNLQIRSNYVDGGVANYFVGTVVLSDGDKIVVAGNEENPAKSLTLSLRRMSPSDYQEFRASISDPDDYDEQIGNGSIGFSKADWEFGTEDEWWIELHLPEYHFNHLIDKFFKNNLESVSFSIKSYHFYIEDEHAPYRWPKTIALPPNKHYTMHAIDVRGFLVIGKTETLRNFDKSQLRQVPRLRRDDYQQILKSFLDNFLREFEPERFLVFNQVRKLSIEVGELEIEYSISNSIPLDEFSDKRLPDALDLVTDLHYAVHGANYAEPWDDEPQDRSTRPSMIWTHKDHILHEAKGSGGKEIDVGYVADVAHKYLEMPWRCRALERLILDMLIAGEIIGFAWYTSNPIYKALNIGPITGWIIGWVFTGLVAAGTFWVASILSHEWAFFGALGVSGLLVLLMLWTTVMLPFNIWRSRQASRAPSELLRAMHSVYCEVGASGPVSPQMVIDLAKDATHKGVVWPGGFYPILEDAVRRGDHI